MKTVEKQNFPAVFCAVFMELVKEVFCILENMLLWKKHFFLILRLIDVKRKGKGDFMMKRIISVAIAILCLLGLLAGCASQGTVQTISEEEGTTITTTVPTVSVTGSGEMDVEPDMATVNLGINVTKSTAEEAMTVTSQTVEQIKGKLLALGINEEDMQTTNFYISPQDSYDNNGNSKGITSYYASNMLEVKIYDLEKVGTVIDSAVEAGANSSYGMYFGLADPLTYESETLKLAVENAKNKAEVLAEAAGKKLGDILVMTDGTTSIPETYVSMERAEDEAMGSSASISTGTLTVSSRVTVRYTIE